MAPSSPRPAPREVTEAELTISLYGGTITIADLAPWSRARYLHALRESGR